MLVLSLLPMIGQLDDPGAPLDEGLLLTEPERVLEGDLPYRDFYSGYGTANTWFLAAAYGIAEPDVDLERAVGIAYRLAVIGAVFLLAAGAGLAVAVAAALISAIYVVHTSVWALAWYGGLAAALLAIWALRPRDPERRIAAGPLALAGVAAGLAVSFRPQLAVALALGAAPLLLGQARPVLWRLGAWTLLGMMPLLVLLPFAGPADMFENLVVAPLIRGSSQSGYPASSWVPLEAAGMLLLGASLAVLCGCAWLAWRAAPRSTEARRLASLALLSLGLLPHTLGRPDFTHIAFVSCVAVALVPPALASGPILERLPSSLGPRGWKTAIAAASIGGVLVAGAAGNLADFYGRALGVPGASEERANRENWAVHGDREFPMDSAEQAAGAEAALAAVDRLTDPGDSLLVGPQDLRRSFDSDTHLYYMLPELEPATYYLVMTPGEASREGSGLADDVSEADVVMLGTGEDWRDVVPNSKLGSDEPVEALRASFCLAAEALYYRIYTPCARGRDPA